VSVKKLLEDYPDACKFEKFVLKHGQQFVAAKPPKKYGRGIIKHCFHNSHGIAKKHGLIYVEGFVLAPLVPFPVLHGWCVEPESLTVIDITLGEAAQCDYFGIAFTKDCLDHHWRTYQTASLIDNWQGGFPVLEMSEEKLHEIIVRIDTAKQSRRSPVKQGSPKRRSVKSTP
jgi:hypothetical protein